MLAGGKDNQLKVNQSFDPNEQPPSLAGRFGGFAILALQLMLIACVVRFFDIAERNHFFVIYCIAAVGFAIHYWLPVRFRTAFFSLLSLGTFLFVLGWPNGAWVLGIAGGFILLCHLPIKFALRVALVALAGLILASYRLDYPEPFWPVLGSMMMFRLIAYLYDLRLDQHRKPDWLTVAYFFPLQNVCFLFFPILDPKTFRETYSREVTWPAVQSGVGWIIHGIIHLLLYRVIKYHIIPSPDELFQITDLALFLVANFALYLRVSAYFHIIIGIFHLFGFQLPRTHHHYFLATSLTDIWRRINIYWKDFMTKVFFLPAFFLLRRFGTRPAAVLATLWVFLATWLLHAYQVFWLTGTLPLARYDAILWLVLGILVSWNVQRDLARVVRSPIVPRQETILSALGSSLQWAGMFVLISVFWSCWNTPMIFKVLPVIRRDSTHLWIGISWIVAILAVAVMVRVVFKILYSRLKGNGLLPIHFSSLQAGLGYLAVLAALIAITFPSISGLFGTRIQSVLTSIRSESMTAAEAERAAQGYYEEMTEARASAGEWMAILERRPRVPDAVIYVHMSRPADDILDRELIPGWSGEIAGSRLTVNSLGMRDRADLTIEKPNNVIRLAFVGTSVVMGYGVTDDQPFTRLLEEQINASQPAGKRYQVLNFGTGKSYPLQRGVLIDRKVLNFQPDAIFYVAHQDEFREPVRNLASLVNRNVALPYPALQPIIQSAAIHPDDTLPMMEVKLRKFAPDIVLVIYQHIVGECRPRGIKPIWVYLPIPGVVDAPIQSTEFARLAREAGFEIIDLSDWAEGRRPAEIKIGEAGPHPNGLGHQLIANRLHAELIRRPELLPNRSR